jgi:hypothetical protein
MPSIYTSNSIQFTIPCTHPIVHPIPSNLRVWRPHRPVVSVASKIARHFGVAVEMLFSFERFGSIAMTLKRAGEDE